jgi:GNAT superfamily N-acetyltransferase
MVDWVRLQLNVAAFDEREFEPCLHRAHESGIRFTSMATLGDTVEYRRALYDLNKACSADIPDRGQFYSYDEYIADRIDVPTFDPAGVILAIHDAMWIGMSATSLHPDQQYAFSEMTGVRAPYRRRGLSLALKLLAIRFARSSGYPRLVAYHHPCNTSAILMNRRLGFVDQDNHTTTST